MDIYLVNVVSHLFCAFRYEFNTVLFSFTARCEFAENGSQGCSTLLLGLERYWHWVIGYWAIFAGIG